MAEIGGTRGEENRVRGAAARLLSVISRIERSLKEADQEEAEQILIREKARVSGLGKELIEAVGIEEIAESEKGVFGRMALAQLLVEEGRRNMGLQRVLAASLEEEVSPEQAREGLRSSILLFLKEFRGFLREERERLGTGLREEIKQLEVLRESVKEDEEGAEMWHKEIEMLRQKLESMVPGARVEGRSGSAEGKRDREIREVKKVLRRMAKIQCYCNYVRGKRPTTSLLAKELLLSILETDTVDFFKVSPCLCLRERKEETEKHPKIPRCIPTQEDLCGAEEVVWGYVMQTLAIIGNAHRNREVRRRISKIKRMRKLRGRIDKSGLKELLHAVAAEERDLMVEALFSIGDSASFASQAVELLYVLARDYFNANIHILNSALGGKMTNVLLEMFREANAGEKEKFSLLPCPDSFTIAKMAMEGVLTEDSPFGKYFKRVFPRRRARASEMVGEMAIRAHRHFLVKRRFPSADLDVVKGNLDEFDLRVSEDGVRLFRNRIASILRIHLIRYLSGIRMGRDVSIREFAEIGMRCERWGILQLDEEMKELAAGVLPLLVLSAFTLLEVPK
jgi:hypothetical protein